MKYFAIPKVASEYYVITFLYDGGDQSDLSQDSLIARISLNLREYSPLRFPQEKINVVASFKIMKTMPSSPIQQPRLYEMVAVRIQKDYVSKAGTGDRLPTETEFADLYKVSVPTIREALRSLVQTGHLRRRQGSGTYKNIPPADPVKVSVAAPAVALISPLDLTDGSLSCFYVQIALQTGKCLKQLGLNSQIYFGETAPASERAFDDSLLRLDIESDKVSAAVLIAETSSAMYPYLQSLQKCGVPVLTMDAMIDTSGHPRLHGFLEQAVDALMRHGRRKIACIGFGAGRTSPQGVDFREIVSSRGGITDDSWIIGDLHPSTMGSGYSLMREIWTTGKIKPDGLVLCDDIFFQDTALAIQELGIKSPDQLLLVTYRNKGERLCSPFPFIEICYDAKEVAEQLAANVFATLQGHPTKPLMSDPTIVDPLLSEDVESVETA